MANESSFVAVAAIPVSVFVKRDTTTDFGMVPCGAGDFADIGVSHEGSQDTLLPGFSGTVIAAEIGSSCKTYGETTTCEITAGAAIVAGAKLKPDASGRAVTAATTNIYSAIANTSAAALGDKVNVTVKYGIVP